jgi:hypothetical protein
MSSKFTKKLIVIPTIVASIVAVAFGVGVYMESRTVHFGSTNDQTPSNRLKKECCKSINREGLDKLNAYGSGIIYYKDFRETFKDKMDKVYVINLLEDEMYYYKDHCLRWYGLGYMDKNLGEVIFARKIFKAAYKSMIRAVYGTPPFHDKSQLQTEKQIVEGLGAKYFLPLKGNSGWLGNQIFIEDLIRIFESIPLKSDVYVHCAHGRGRTTTFLVLYDIFRNSKKVSLKDIATRNHCLGREDVLNTDLWEKGTWTQRALNARKDLVERFYAYMNDPQGYGHQSWSQWNVANGVKETKVDVHR